MAQPVPSYWLTTHWPGLKDRPYVQNVYLKAEHRGDCQIKPGDLVLVYEFKIGPVVLEGGRQIHRRMGREGIVLLAEVVSEFRERLPSVALQEYADGTKANWRWEAAAKPVARGFIPRTVVNRELKYSTGNRFFGFNAGRGYKRLSDEQFARLKRAMNVD